LSSLLARFAENSFWIARYMERAENLARILDINETFARDVHGSSDWLPILKLHCDEERFFERYRAADAGRVLRFYIIDQENENSIVYSVRAARENARSIRHLISLEMWVQLNVFHNWVSSLTKRSLELSQVSRLCAQIKESCQLHFGIVSGTLYRDQVFSFYRLGTFIELCDQITRVVDMKYHSLLPHWKDVGSAIDIAQWNALLRSVSAYHGYRRAYPREMTPTTVAGFILFDPNFPRSIPHCVRNIELTLNDLLRRDELRHVEFPTQHLDALKALAERHPKEVIAAGLHEFLDEVQVALIAVGEQISTTFFASKFKDVTQMQSAASG
jgi:uncharacterized alpha-E superfamily protein